ncbi:MAG: hypothetical protein RIQ96_891 [Pseudomonadota bacterium]
MVLPHRTLGNRDIAAVLEHIADLLEVQGANVFRVRAYRNAARTLAMQARSVGELVAQGEPAQALQALPGVGPDLASAIIEIHDHGRCAQLDALEHELPEGLTQLLAFPGIGPKRVQQLREALQVDSLEDVLRAAQQGRIRSLRGFGAATERRIRDGILARMQPALRFAPHRVQAMAQALLPRLRSAPGVEQAVVAGSLRRMRDTIGDLDLLVGATQATAVMDRFVTGPEVMSVLSRGTTRASVMLHDGLQVDLRVVDPSSFGAAWLYFTGSKAHNIALRRRAMAQGLKLNEYGLYRGTDTVASRTEEEVYRALGLPWLAPELREDNGEIEAALAGRLPQLLMRSQLRGDLHVQMPPEGPAISGRDRLQALADAARAQGMDYLGITLVPQRRARGGVDLARLAADLERIERFNARGGPVRLLAGLALAIRDDGLLDWPAGMDEALHARIDFVSAALRDHLDLPSEQQTRRVLTALAQPQLAILSHPLASRSSLSPVMVDLQAVMRAAHAHGCVLEVHGDPLELDLDDSGCRLARDEGVMLSISSGAHEPGELDRIGWGVGQARRGWVSSSQVLNTLPLAELRKHLAQRAGCSRHTESAPQPVPQPVPQPAPQPTPRAAMTAAPGATFDVADAMPSRAAVAASIPRHPRSFHDL